MAGDLIKINAEVLQVLTKNSLKARPICLEPKLELPRNQLSTTMFLRGDPVRGEPVHSSAGFVCCVMAYLEERDGKERITIGVAAQTSRNSPTSGRITCRVQIKTNSGKISCKPVVLTTQCKPDKTYEVTSSFVGVEHLLSNNTRVWTDGKMIVEAMVESEDTASPVAGKNEVPVKPNVAARPHAAIKQEAIAEKAVTEKPGRTPPVAAVSPVKKVNSEKAFENIGSSKLQSKSGDVVTFSDYQYYGAPLGEGAFGKVYKGRNRKTREEVAVKVVDYHGQSAAILNEVTILMELDDKSRHLISIFEVHVEVSKIFIVMELCNAGDLSDFLERNANQDEPGLGEAVIKHFLRQIVSAMRALRDNNIIHRDLKPQNVLLHNPKGSLFYYDLTLKVADFGLARFLDDSTKMSLCGTLAYMAPEMLRAWTPGRCYGKYTAKVDLWSIGMILYECLTGEVADLDPDNGYKPELHYHRKTSSGIRQLISQLLRADPKQRMDFDNFFAAADAYCKNTT